MIIGKSDKDELCLILTVYKHVQENCELHEFIIKNKRHFNIKKFNEELQEFRYLVISEQKAVRDIELGLYEKIQ